MKSEPKRAAIYARFSTDMQKESSISDQFALCREHANRLGLEVVAEFSDRARTSASLIGRDGALDMMAAAKNQEFDVLIVEALDRLSRDQEDLAGLFKRLTFHGIAIEAVHDGKADQVQIGIRGMLGSLFLADLAHKVRRGMQGVVREGRNPGGRAYGYRPRKGEPGILDIQEDEAEVVRRIFHEYNLGKTPRLIARDLNRDGVPPPRSGGTWNASTINGNMERGNGILQNPLYKGTLIWNRVRMIRDPDTGKRVSRVNPESEWQITECPELAIIDQETFATAQARKQENRRVWASKEFRPKKQHMFSGLLKCAVCGSGMTLDGKKDGHQTIRCSRARESSSCTNTRRARLDKIERTVIDGLKREFSTPGALHAYVEGFKEEWRRLVANAGTTRARAEKELAEVKVGIDRLADAIAAGIMDREDLDGRYKALRARRQELIDEIAMSEAQVPTIRIEDEALEHYRQVLENLAAEMRAEVGEDIEMRAALRDLIKEIQVTTEPELSVQVIGKMGALMTKTPGLSNRGIEVVAEVRPHTNPPGKEVVAGARICATPPEVDLRLRMWKAA